MKKFIYVFLPLLLLSACKNAYEVIKKEQPVTETPTPNAFTQINLTPDQQEMVKAIRQFSNNFMAEAIADNPNNFVASPLSASVLVSLILNGTDETTQQEMLKVLGISNLDMLNELNHLLLTKYAEADNQIKFQLGNALWLNQNALLNSAYSKTLEDVYEIFIGHGDLSSLKTMGDINEWVNEKTFGLIPNFLSRPFDKSQYFTLINTCYFKGSWALPFDKSATKDAPFYSNNGNTSIVPTMHGKYEKLSYVAGENFTSVTKPYGNGAFTFTIILPDEGVDIQSAFNTYNRWSNYVARVTEVAISIPRFNLYSTLENLESYLYKMGFSNLLEEKNFTGITDPTSTGANTARIFQKTVFALDEEGVEAAAVTGEEWASAVPPDERIPEKVDFKVNRPFIFLIQEISTQCTLFSGVVKNL